jgi:hypothetical protein
MATATDNCDMNVPVIHEGDVSVVNPDCPEEYSIRRIFAATDNCSNTGGCEQTLVVLDPPPVITCPSDEVVVCNSSAGFPIGGLFLEATATDECNTVESITDDRPSDFYPPTCDGSGNVVTFTATDSCGHQSSCEVRVRVIGGMCCPSIVDTDLKLMPVDLDVRQDNDGPVTTKARFDIWNSNEIRFSGTQKCITCWDETLLSLYPAPNNFLVNVMQTDKGKARIHGDGFDSDSSGTPPCVGPNGPSVESPLLGVSIKEVRFAGSPRIELRAASTLIGNGDQAATLRYDIINEPDESNLPGGSDEATKPSARGGPLARHEGTRIGDGQFPALRASEGRDAAPAGGNPGTLPELALGALMGGGVVGVPSVGTGPGEVLDHDGSAFGELADNRAQTTYKGSLIYWPVVELKWDYHGNLIQDTIIQLLNDSPNEIKVQLYLVNGDAPLDAVIDDSVFPPVILERVHPGWNWVDVQITLTGDESAYWSAYSGDPKGVSPFGVLDPGNPVGRPDLDPNNPGGRLVRGFMVGWAVDDFGHEIRWNHLKGHGMLVHFTDGTAADYNPWSFRCVAGVPEGSEPDGEPGQLLMDGVEYDYAPNQLVFDFYTPLTQPFSHPSVRP